MDITLIIPCYNDSVRLKTFLPELCLSIRRVEARNGASAEIIIVDDGSRKEESEATKKLCSTLAAHSVKYLSIEKNIGKGGAIYEGWEKAKGSTWLGFIDADGAISPEEAESMINFVLSQNKWGAVIGSRIKMLGHNVERKLLRHITGRIFAAVCYLYTGLPVYDSQCGIKFVKKELYSRIKHSLEENRFAFDVELLLKLNNVGTIKEFPIDWKDMAGSKVRLIRDGLTMYIAIRNIARRHRKSANNSNSHLC